MSRINELKAENQVILKHIRKAEMKFDENMREMESLGSKPACKTGKWNFEKRAIAKGYKVEKEVIIAKGERQFRTDWVVSFNGNVALCEFDGITAKSFYHTKENGDKIYCQTMNGHTSKIGYESDCIKHNLNASLGYHTFRYTRDTFDTVWENLERYFND